MDRYIGVSDNDFHSFLEGARRIMLSLAEIAEGKSVIVVDLSAVRESVKRRLLDLGVHEGITIRVARCLPFGGPLMIECDGQFIGLRRREAPLIGVIPRW